MKRIRFLTFCFLLCLFSLLCAGAWADESPAPFENSSLRRVVTLPGTGRQMYYYAQNDPIWDETRYELKNGKGLRRTFGGGGCNPTALAMAVANLVPEEDLPLIAQHTKEGRPISFCPGTVSGFFCYNHQEDETITLTQPWEYKRLLPLVFGHYACYNNDQNRTFRLTGKSGGTTYNLFYPIAELYGLTVSSTRDLQEALDALHTGSQVVILSAGSRQPFSEANGHFLILGDSDAQGVYLLDPQIVEKYPRDKRHILKFIENEPGLLHVAYDDVDRLCVSYYFIFTNDSSGLTPDAEKP